MFLLALIYYCLNHDVVMHMVPYLHRVIVPGRTRLVARLNERQKALGKVNKCLLGGYVGKDDTTIVHPSHECSQESVPVELR